MTIAWDILKQKHITMFEFPRIRAPKWLLIYLQRIFGFICAWDNKLLVTDREYCNCVIFVEENTQVFCIFIKQKPNFVAKKIFIVIHALNFVKQLPVTFVLSTPSITDIDINEISALFAHKNLFSNVVCDYTFILSIKCDKQSQSNRTIHFDTCLKIDYKYL